MKQDLGRSVAGVALAVVLAGSSGCMDTPRDGSSIAHPSGPVAFHGYTVTPDELVWLQIWNREDEAWMSYWGAYTSPTAAATDSAGVSWYQYLNSEIPLPYGAGHERRFWKKASSDGDQRRISIDFRGWMPNYANTGEALASFGTEEDTGLQACVDQQETGADVINHCKSPNSPKATVFAPCGKPGQACCLAYGKSKRRSCDTGRRCDLGAASPDCSIVSGGYDQPCHGDRTCDANSSFPGGTACVHDRCRTPLDRAPVYLVELDLTYATVSPSNGKRPALAVRLKDDYFVLYPSAGDLNVGTSQVTHRYSLSPGDVHSISDIERLYIKASRTGDYTPINLTEIKLRVNGQRIFDWSGSRVMATPLLLNEPYEGNPPQYSGSPDYFKFSATDLRSHPKWVMGSACDLPRLITRQQLQTKFRGLVGAELASDDLLSWGSGGLTLGPPVTTYAPQIPTPEPMVPDDYWGEYNGVPLAPPPPIPNYTVVDMDVHARAATEILGFDVAAHADVAIRMPFSFTCSESNCSDQLRLTEVDGVWLFLYENKQNNNELGPYSCQVDAGAWTGTPQISIDGDALVDALLGFGDFFSGGSFTEFATIFVGQAATQAADADFSFAQVPTCLQTRFQLDGDLEIGWVVEERRVNPTVYGTGTVDLLTHPLYSKIQNPLCVDLASLGVTLPELPGEGEEVSWDVVDDDHGSWSYEAGFGAYSEPGAYAQTVHISDVRGAYAEQSFLATDLEVYGGKGPQGGTAELFIDDVSYGTANLYAAQDVQQELLFSVSDLLGSPHLLRLEQVSDTGQVSIDYIRTRFVGDGYGSEEDWGGYIPPAEEEPSDPDPDPPTDPSPPTEWTVLDSAEPGWSFGGGYFTFEDPDAYQGSSLIGDLPGGYAEQGFEGTELEVYGWKGDDGGVVELFVDGISQGTADLYSDGDQYQALMFSVSGLQPASHSLRLEQTSSEGTWTTVDYIRYRASDGTSGGGDGAGGGGGGEPGAWTVVDDNETGWTFGGGYFFYEDPGAYQGTAHGNGSQGGYAEISFAGTEVEVFGWRGPDGGVVELFIDGVSQGTANLYEGSGDIHDQLLLSVANLSSSSHLLRVEQSNPTDSGWTMVDYIRYR